MRLSIQLYTVRDLIKDDLIGTLTALKSAGLDQVEMAGFNDISAEDWKSMLSEIGLTVSGGHEGLDGLENDFDEIVERNKVIGNKSIVIPYLGKDVWSDGWPKVAKRFEIIGKKLKNEGLQLAYHNHDFEFQLEDGMPGLDVLYANSDPELLKAQLDLAWILQGGQDPAAYIEKYADRIDSVHIKDTKLVGHHQDVVAGEGNLNWDTALAACEKAGVANGSIEMDNPPGDVLESVKGCITFFHSRGIR